MKLGILDLCALTRVNKSAEQITKYSLGKDMHVDTITPCHLS